MGWQSLWKAAERRYCHGEGDQAGAAKGFPAGERERLHPCVWLSTQDHRLSADYIQCAEHLVAGLHTTAFPNLITFCDSCPSQHSCFSNLAQLVCVSPVDCCKHLLQWIADAVQCFRWRRVPEVPGTEPLAHGRVLE